MNLVNVGARLLLYRASTSLVKIIATRLMLLAYGGVFSASDLLMVQMVDKPSLTGVTVDFSSGYE